MSDFTMGATLTLTDNFSSTLTAAGHNAEAFKSQITGISSAMSSSTASMAETASAANGLGSGLQNVGSIADSMGSSMTDAVSGAESMADTIQEIGSAAQESQALSSSLQKVQTAGKLLWTSSTLEPNTLNNYLEL